MRPVFLATFTLLSGCGRFGFESHAIPTEPRDAAIADASSDASLPDGDRRDADPVDDRPELPDGEVPDGELPDGDVPDDATDLDAEVPDGEVPDAEVPDATVPDAEVPDAAVPDASTTETCDLVDNDLDGFIDEGPLTAMPETIVGTYSSLGGQHGIAWSPEARRFAVSYTDFNAATTYAAIFDEDGTMLVAPLVVGTAGQYVSDVTWDGTAFRIAYAVRSFSSFTIDVVSMSPTGVLGTPIGLDTAGRSALVDNVSITALDNGDLAIGFSQVQLSPYQTWARLALVRRLGASTTVDLETSTDAIGSTLVAARGTRIFVAWSRRSSDGNYYARLAAVEAAELTTPPAFEDLTARGPRAPSQIAVAGDSVALYVGSVAGSAVWHRDSLGTWTTPFSGSDATLAGAADEYAVQHLGELVRYTSAFDPYTGPLTLAPGVYDFVAIGDASV